MIVNWGQLSVFLINRFLFFVKQPLTQFNINKQLFLKNHAIEDVEEFGY